MPALIGRGPRSPSVSTGSSRLNVGRLLMVALWVSLPGADVGGAWSGVDRARAAGRILSRRSDSHPTAQACALGARVRRRGKTGSPHGFGDPRSSVSCAAITLRARFAPLRACHGAHSRASLRTRPAAREQTSSAVADLELRRRDTCCGSEPCERRVAGDRRENTLQGRPPARSRISTPPRRRARRGPRTWPGRIPSSREVFSRAVEQFAEQHVSHRRSRSGYCRGREIVQVETDPPPNFARSKGNRRLLT